ncbi:methionyl-tRNA formyltransferase [Schumannella sp. 10F1B-5-1]|uniref:methionyl-tRNA formyltransferase n=1 Tax=Schumannella sp. 10F1B-5-1 TaxID=2590780 RepID=UPI0011312AC1|nr:methionyl-tRNA formyltransferase [Schumannella sp. 10F1B-5-1]TPW71026.1 methionyl-tRNA formyltransferase [Schumannella sp. 10F1B-5-1]
MTPLRLIFAGSPAAAAPSLRRLLDSPHEVAAVVTRPDTPQGRKRVLTPTPVAQLAEEAGVPVVRAARLAPVADELIALEADLGVVVAYGGLIREPLLSAPRLGWINLHFSLLPAWRGAAPVQHALIAGDETTGASVFRLVEELDAGPLLATEATPVGRHSTAGELLTRLADSGAELLTRTVDGLADGTLAAVEQQGEPSFAPKLTLDDGRLDWTRPGAELVARLRGVTPEPGAWTTLDGDRFKVLAGALAHDVGPLAPGAVDLRAGQVVVGTADTPVELTEVQPAGKKGMRAADWWRGRQGATVLS